MLDHPSRFAVKSFIPPTNDADRQLTSPPPPSTATVERFPDWSGKTAAFLSAAPEPAVHSDVPTIKTSDLASAFRHSGWAPFRRRVEAAMAALPDLSPRRLTAFRYCGSDAFVERATVGKLHPSYVYRLRSTKCHDRFCVPCSSERAMRIRDAILMHTCKMQNMSLITLTQAQSDAPLSEQIDRLTANFKKLRNTPLWKKAVKGGASIIEHKVGADGRRWNIHYHVVLQCGFMDQKKLSDLWLKISGDSYIVDIRRVGSMGGAVQYITKYVTKAADPSVVLSPDHLKQAILAFAGRRLVATFGNWRGLALLERPDDEKACDLPKERWEFAGSLDDVMRSAARGDSVSLQIMRAIAPRKFKLHEPGPAPP